MLVPIWLNWHTRQSLKLLLSRLVGSNPTIGTIFLDIYGKIVNSFLYPAFLPIARYTCTYNTQTWKQAPYENQLVFEKVLIALPCIPYSECDKQN